MIKGFNRDEKKALVAILKYIVSADGRISEGEISKFNELAEKKGFEDFDDIFSEVDSEIETINDLNKLITQVTSETHKYDILKHAIEISLADATIVPEEAKIIKTLGKEWGIDVKSVLKGE